MCLFFVCDDIVFNHVLTFTKSLISKGSLRQTFRISTLSARTSISPVGISYNLQNGDTIRMESFTITLMVNVTATYLVITVSPCSLVHLVEA